MLKLLEVLSRTKTPGFICTAWVPFIILNSASELPTIKTDRRRADVYPPRMGPRSLARLRRPREADPWRDQGPDRCVDGTRAPEEVRVGTAPRAVLSANVENKLQVECGG